LECAFGVDGNILASKGAIIIVKVLVDKSKSSYIKITFLDFHNDNEDDNNNPAPHKV
jgi:hypothetical protein